MPRTITPSTSLDNLRKEAKRWLRELRAGEPEALARLERATPKTPARPVLRDVQDALSHEYGCESWVALKTAVERRQAPDAAPDLSALSVADHEQLATDIVAAYDNRDEAALARTNVRYRRAFAFDDLSAEIWRRVYAFRQRSSKVVKNFIQLDEAQTLIAQDAGFASWSALTALTGAAATGSRRVPPYAIDEASDGIGPRRRLTDAEWDELLEVMKERRMTSLHANGLMTDRVMARLATFEHVTGLALGGSREMTDKGLQSIGRMTQLESLNLSGYPGGTLTDEGLAVLEHLPNLKRFEMTWQRGISDTGVAHLRRCDRLEVVDLMGSPTGDGVIEALQNKPALRYFNSGRLVTDVGLGLLHNFPLFRAPWRGSDDEGDRAPQLLIDGPFTNQGLASLAGLDGVVGLDLFWHVSGITTDAFAYLKALPNLQVLGADGALSDDTAMAHFAAIPRLRRLRVQETPATDAGWEALSRSRTLEHLWGRDCKSLGDRGFMALSTMPALKGLGVSCKNVSDRALALLPRFPSLRELTPIAVQDDGFRHVGQCAQLERLTCMYCRESGDAATAHIASLPIKYYYAGLTQITDRSLEILGRMDTLEQIEFYECKGLSDAGLPFLARLPRLREIHLDSLPNVTFEGTRVFPARVKVQYST